MASSLWDPPDGEGEDYPGGSVADLTPHEHDDAARLPANQSGCYPGDWLSYPQCCYEDEDVIEEDALNEKSCLQVLRILIEKADEEIVELERELLMLHCQLELEDDGWTKRWYDALTERLDHVDALIRNLKEDGQEQASDSSAIQSEQLGKLLPESLHDVLKPLLESHISAERKQKGNCTKGMSACTSKHAGQSEADKSISAVDASEMENQTIEPNDDSINRLGQPRNFSLHLKSDGRRRMINDARKVYKRRPYSHGSRSLAKLEGTNIKSSERAESGKTEDSLGPIGRRRGTKKDMSKSKLIPHNDEALSTNKSKSISSSMPDGEGSEKKLKQAHSDRVGKKPRKDTREQKESSCRI